MGQIWDKMYWNLISKSPILKCVQFVANLTHFIRTFDITVQVGFFLEIQIKLAFKVIDLKFADSARAVDVLPHVCVVVGTATADWPMCEEI